MIANNPTLAKAVLNLAHTLRMLKIITDKEYEMMRLELLSRLIITRESTVPINRGKIIR